MLKRKIALLLVIVLILGLFVTGCGGTKEVEMDETMEEAVLPAGDLASVEIEDAGKEMTKKEENEMKRAMRAYKPAESTLLINKAKKYYFYSQLSANQKKIYEALFVAASDPEKAECRAMFLSGREAFSEKFWNDYHEAYYSLVYDHPELFWLYMGKDTYFYFYHTPGSTSGGKNIIYVKLNAPVKNYRENQKRFNKAAKTFLKGIDTSKTKKEQALWVHDKLIKQVSYDYPVADKNLNADFAHSAYGALVENSRGKDYKAVCDGYALAYEYLLQQLGIEASIVIGSAGGDKNNLGLHAWNIVKFGKKWVETDACWDDAGNPYSRLDKKGKWYKYQKEAYTDKKYRKFLDHYLYNVTTKKMKHYVPTDKDRYLTKDKKWYFTMTGESYHIREKTGNYGRLMKMAPTAE
ncbi:MAG: hypothetical protein MJ087_00140 [Lachnospiraceae bacterium]|nr:hypothetical protein [Lachnospiraceae bacterium]